MVAIARCFGLIVLSYEIYRQLHHCGEHVSLVPSAAFHRSSEELTARMAYVNFNGAKALSASETILLDQQLSEDFIEFWRQDIIEVTQRIVDWIPESGR